MIEAHKILKEFRLTEKSNLLASNSNQYTFEIHPSAGRKQVADAVAKVFNVNVVRVNVLNVKGKTKANRFQRGKRGRKADVKKAIVTLKAGETIEMI